MRRSSIWYGLVVFVLVYALAAAVSGAISIFLTDWWDRALGSPSSNYEYYLMFVGIFLVPLAGLGYLVAQLLLRQDGRFASERFIPTVPIVSAILVVLLASVFEHATRDLDSRSPASVAAALASRVWWIVGSFFTTMGSAWVVHAWQALGGTREKH